MTPAEFSRNVQANHWHWTLKDFAAKLGKRPDDFWVQEKFTALDALATALRPFDEHLLGVVSSPNGNTGKVNASLLDACRAARTFLGDEAARVGQSSVSPELQNVYAKLTEAIIANEQD